jgi:hypothetical protein
MIKGVITFHFYERIVERLSFKGTMEELAEKLNNELKQCFILKNKNLYFPECNLVVPTRFNPLTKETILVTALMGVCKTSRSKETRINWMVSNVPENTTVA